MEVYARMIGTKVCLTRPSGSFIMLDREEMSEEELKFIDAGGGDIVVNDLLSILEWK